MGFNCLKATEALPRDSLLFTSLQEGMALISLTGEEWKAESTLELTNRFEIDTQQLGIQYINHRPLHQLPIKRFLVWTLIIYILG